MAERSVEGQLEDEQAVLAEIARRDAEVDAGKVKPVPFDEAMRQIRDSLQ
jgi:hypothetical protein